MVGSVVTTTEKDKKNTTIILKTLLAGGTAGCTAKTCVAPLDRVKILMQGHNKHYQNTGVFQSIDQVFRKEGVRGLFKGNYMQMLRVFPYAAIQFMSYEQYKKENWFVLQIPSEKIIQKNS